jgi:hypothetical protein
MGVPAQIKLGRFLWVGPLTIANSVVTVLLIRTLAIAILKPDAKFLPLTSVFPVGDTVIGSACAVFALFCMARYSSELVHIIMKGIQHVSDR